MMGSMMGMTDVTQCNGCGKLGPKTKWGQFGPPGWYWAMIKEQGFHLCEMCTPVFQCMAMDCRLLPDRKINPSSPTNSPPLNPPEMREA